MKRITLLFLLVALPVFPAEKISWYTDLNKALAEAKKTNKPIFVDVWADWCHWCHKLDQEVYSNPRFVQYMKNFVTLKIDSEDGKEGTRFTGKYEITGLPTLLVLDPGGRVLNRLSGFKTVDALIKELDRIQQLLVKEYKSPSDITVTLELAEHYMQNEMNKEAEDRFRRVLAGKATPQQKEKALFHLGLVQYYQNKLPAALDTLNSYYKTYPGGPSYEDALLLLSQIHIEMNSNKQALRYLREFMKKYPTSGNAARAKQVLIALEKECPKC